MHHKEEEEEEKEQEEEECLSEIVYNGINLSQDPLSLNDWLPHREDGRRWVG